MKAKLIVVVCFYVALLPSIKAASSSNESDESDEEPPFQEYLNKLDDFAKRGIVINDVFILSKDGFLGFGSFGFTYKGTLQISSSKKKMVAMKFTPEENKDNALKEYEMYTYLGAINNASTETCGIPSVYYYGQWNGCYLMAITLLDTESYQMRGPNGINQVDVLIVFREFVRITKYMHSRGVRHNDIKLDNIMFLEHQAFIIDFNKASKMYEKKTSLSFLSMEEHEAGKRYAKEDWASFLTVMCSFNGIKFDFAILGSDSSVGLFNENDIRSNIIDTMETLEKIEHGGLKRVFVEFAKHAFQDAIASSQDKRKKKRYAVLETIPFYDQLYKIINEEIAKYSHENPAFVSWLTGSIKKKAVKSLKNHPIPVISSINDPFGMIEPVYPKVEFNYFSNHLSVAESSTKKTKHNH